MIPDFALPLHRPVPCSFIQILKAFTPALTLVVGVLAGVEQLTAALVASVLLIAVGTG